MQEMAKPKKWFSVKKLYFRPNQSLLCCQCDVPLIVELADYYLPGNYKRWCANCGLAPEFRILDRIFQNGGIIPVSQLPGYDEFLDDFLKEPGNKNESEKKYLKKEKIGEIEKMKVQAIDDYVDASFAQAHPEFSFVDEGKMIDDNFREGSQKLEIKVKAGNEYRLYTPNKTTYNWLIKTYGDDTAKWMNKKMKWVVHSQIDKKTDEVRKSVYIEGMDV